MQIACNRLLEELGPGRGYMLLVETRLFFTPEEQGLLRDYQPPPLRDFAVSLVEALRIVTGEPPTQLGHTDRYTWTTRFIDPQEAAGFQNEIYSACCEAWKYIARVREFSGTTTYTFTPGGPLTKS
jgi:hypothetical protein